MPLKLTLTRSIILLCFISLSTTITLISQIPTPWITVKYDSESIENWKSFHENGNPSFEGTIIDNLLQGSYKMWYENGQLAESLNFDLNLENGTAYFYHMNGQLAIKGIYYMGKMVGDWRFYDEDGNPFSGYWRWGFAVSPEDVRMEGEVLNGRQIGIWKYKSTADLGNTVQEEFGEDIIMD